MSRVNDLIAELCSDGVKFKRLGDIVRIKNGRDHKSLGDGEIPVYGSGGIMRYADTYAYNRPSVLIPRKGSLGNLFFVDVPFWNVDTIFYTEIDEAQIRPKFLYYFLMTVGLGEMNKAGGVPSQTQSVLNELEIPIPPFEVQDEVVRILDSFAELKNELTDELTGELEARKKQYNYYLGWLLNFEGKEVALKRLGDVVRIKNGRDHKSLGDGEFPVYGSGGIMRYANTYAYNKPSVLIPRKGSLGNLFYVDVPFWNVDTIFYTEIDEAQIRPKFLYYFLMTVGLGGMNKAGGVPSQTQSVLNELKIPVPSIDEQERIISILEKVNALSNSLIEGLRREVELRHKQYVYCRDLLLTYPKPEEVEA
ncbi:restriction endonuclease subunit S [Pseudomonas tructae]|nr:restriction endonuclease subunit S [Pseudomonas tructae]